MRQHGTQIQWDTDAVWRGIKEHGYKRADDFRPHFVYRVFDAAGALLYIGLTRSPWERFNGHTRSPWYPDADRVDWEFVGDRAAGLAAERTAISSEHPIYNQQHKTAVAS